MRPQRCNEKQRKTGRGGLESFQCLHENFVFSSTKEKAKENVKVCVCVCVCVRACVCACVCVRV